MDGSQWVPVSCPPRQDPRHSTLTPEGHQAIPQSVAPLHPETFARPRSDLPDGVNTARGLSTKEEARPPSDCARTAGRRACIPLPARRGTETSGSLREPVFQINGGPVSPHPKTWPRNPEDARSRSARTPGTSLEGAPLASPHPSPYAGIRAGGRTQPEQSPREALSDRQNGSTAPPP